MFDYLVSSYAPTVRSINGKVAKSSGSSTKTLFPSRQPAKYPRASTKHETNALKMMMEQSGIDAQLLEDCDATLEKVKEEFNSHSWAHFAYHGVQDPKEPLESGLCLHDSRLELLEIMKQRIDSPDFVFLSACQTSTGEFNLSEEVVHLAAGMLAAGYHGVVGTMWNISDKHGPQFAKEFYQYLLERQGPNGLDSTLAAYALDHATTEFRKALGNENDAFLKWVPYVHFGY